MLDPFKLEVFLMISRKFKNKNKAMPSLPQADLFHFEKGRVRGSSITNPQTRKNRVARKFKKAQFNAS